MCSNISAELSPDYKRKLVRKVEEEQQLMMPTVELPQNFDQMNPNSPTINLHHHSKQVDSPGQIKDVPRRRSEHEKWKIMPKKIYDKTTYVVEKRFFCDW